MKFIDTHIHLQDYKSSSAPQIIAVAQECGVRGFVCLSARESDWTKVLELSNVYPEVVPALGLHPWYARQVSEKWSVTLERLLVQNPRAQVGEAGLDRIKDNELSPQAEVFQTQIDLAKKYNRVLLIHAVKAAEWLPRFWPLLNGARFVFHSFTGARDLVKPIVEAGGYISFSQSILKIKNAAEIVRAIPQNRLLLETDGPYQSLKKDEESSPCFLPQLAEKIAAFRGENVTEFAAAVYQNSKDLFYGK